LFEIQFPDTQGISVRGGGRFLAGIRPSVAMSPKISIRLLAAQSDQRLVKLVHEGHERAFEALVHRYRRPLLHYCRRAMRMSNGRAEDVLQNAMLQAWLALARGTEVRDLKPWLYRIVHNAAVNAMRDSSESDGELTDAIQATSAVASESDLDRRLAVGEALADVAALPRMQSQAMFLTAVDGHSHDEVASALGITHGAVRGLLYRARATLRSAAAAITPQPLVSWASGGGSSVPTAERVAELSTAGGAFGTTGLLLKGVVVAVTAGALATGATVVHLHQHGVRRPGGRTPSAHVARSAGTGGSTLARAAETTSMSPTGTVTGLRDARARARAGVGHGTRGFGPAGAAPTQLVRRVSPASSPQFGAEHDSLQGVAPSGRHSDGQGDSGTNADVADAGGQGSANASGGHGGQNSGGSGTQGSGSPHNGPRVDGSGVGNVSGGGGPVSPLGGAGQTVAPEDHPGGESTNGSGG
jgi:RNA polymerase sigma factor (sigma-70 family)